MIEREREREKEEKKKRYSRKILKNCQKCSAFSPTLFLHDINIQRDSSGACDNC
jgi:hypothetical protein